MRILVTRPLEDSNTLRQRLEGLGHRVMVAPMFSIGFETDAALNLNGVQGLIATSRNGLKALVAGSQLSQAISLPLYAVGPATAEMAREFGFKNVVVGPGTARELAGVIAGCVRPEDGSLVHLAGRSLAFDMKGALEQKGFTVHVEVLYRTVESQAFAPDVITALRERTLDAVMLMSPKSAEVFARLSMDAGVAEPVRKMAFLCLSSEVARCVSSLAPINLMTAQSPNLEEMLALVTLLAAKSA